MVTSVIFKIKITTEINSCYYLHISFFSIPGDCLSANSDQVMSNTTVGSELHNRKQRIKFSVLDRNLIISRFGMMITGDQIEPVERKEDMSKTRTGKIFWIPLVSKL